MGSRQALHPACTRLDVEHRQDSLMSFVFAAESRISISSVRFSLVTPGIDVAQTEPPANTVSVRAKNDMPTRKHDDAGTITLGAAASNANYTFSLASDDGSVLYIDGGAALVNNSGASLNQCGCQIFYVRHMIYDRGRVGIEVCQREPGFPRAGEW